MITIFAIPKPFVGHSAVIQRNAIASWIRLRPACEVILLGDDEGVAEAAAEFNVRHIPNVARNEFGTPLLDSAFRMAGAAAKFPLLCYVNADIMFTNDFLRAAQRLGSRRFLMVGQRWDIDLKTPWEFSGESWKADLEKFVAAQGALHAAAGSDYFLFRRGDPLGELPAFAVGRPGWDNWFLQNALRLKVPIVDASTVTTVIHQNHDYRHVPQGIAQSYEGPEGKRNFQIAGDMPLPCTIEDATHQLRRSGIWPNWTPRRMKRQWLWMKARRTRPLILLLLLSGVLRRLMRPVRPYPAGYAPLPLSNLLAELFGRKRLR